MKNLTTIQLRTWSKKVVDSHSPLISWSKVGEKTHFEGNFGGFCPYLCIHLSKFSEIHICNKPNIIQHLTKRHVQKKSCSSFIVGTRPLFLKLNNFLGIFGVFHITLLSLIVGGVNYRIFIFFPSTSIY